VSVNPVPAILDNIRALEGIEDREAILKPNKVVEYIAHMTVPGELAPDASQKLAAHIASAADYNLFIERCRDVLLALVALPEYQLS